MEGFPTQFGELEPFRRHIQAVGGAKVIENKAGIVWELENAETDELFMEICVNYGRHVQIWKNRVLVPKETPPNAEPEEKATNAETLDLNETLFRKNEL